MRRFVVEGARAVILLFAVVGLMACFTGCSGRALTPEEQAEVEALNKRNAELIDQMNAIREKAKTGGTMELIQVAALLKPLQEQFESNTKTIKKLQENTGMSWWETTILVLHRTILHGVKAAIPAKGGLVLMGINALLTFVLGGSSTKHLPEPKPAPATGPATPA